MNTTDLTNVCRICPNAGDRGELYNVFDETLALTYNLKEVILVTTGVKIITNDLISTKICKKCCNITLKMFQFRQDALKQDQALKDMLNQHLENEGLKLPNTCITIKKDKTILKPPAVTNVEQSTPSTTKETLKKTLHPSVADLYKKYPGLKLATRCLEKDISPFVSLAMGDVEGYFKNQQLDIRKFVYKPQVKCHSFKAVAKKSTSALAKPKTVAPLKISLKMLTNVQSPVDIQSNYACTPLPKKRGRKRKIPLTENDECSKSKVFNRPIKPVPESATIITNITQRIDSTLGATDSIGVSEPIIPVTSTQIAPNIKDSSVKSLSISETTVATSANKPEFIESLGLTPRICTKSQKLYVCNVCGSVHNSAIDLRWHSRIHMVCPFCKRKCKSIDAKQNHIENFCKIKRFMNSPGLIVSLEKVHMNLDVRKKYMNAFSSFDPIPGLIEPAPLEHVLLEAASPPPDVSADGIIVLSDDDDESSAGSSDPLSDTLPAGAVRNSVAQIRPDIKIKKNTVFSHLASRTSDKEMIKDLIKNIRPEKPSTCDQILQTNLPDNRCIKIKNTKGTCEFKNLREQLMFYKIPIKVNHGVFKVSYQLTENSAPKKSMEFWNDLPVIDHYKSRTPKPTNPSSTGNHVANQNGSIAESQKNNNIDASTAQANSISEAHFFAPSTVSTTLANTNTNVNHQDKRFFTSLSCPNVTVSTQALKNKSSIVNSNVSSMSLVSPLSSGIMPTKSVKPTSEASKSGVDQQERSSVCHSKLPTLTTMKTSNDAAVLDLTLRSITRASSSVPVPIPTTAALSSTLCDNIGISNRNNVCSLPNLLSHNTVLNGEMSVVNSQVNSTAVANNYSSSAKIPTATSNLANLPSFSTPTNYSSLPTNTTHLTNTGVSSYHLVPNNVTQATSNQVLNSPGDSTFVASKTSLVNNKSMPIPKTYGKIVLNKNTAADRCLIENSSYVKSPTPTESNIVSGSSFANISNINRSVVGSYIVRPDPSASVIQPPINTSMINGCFSTTITNGDVPPPGPPPGTNLPPLANTLNFPPLSNEPVKFRVKKVWELQ